MSVTSESTADGVTDVIALIRLLLSSPVIGKIDESSTYVGMRERKKKKDMLEA